MVWDRQLSVVVLAAISVLVSASMVIVALTSPAFPIWPIIALNWLFFISLTWLVGGHVSIFGRRKEISRTNQNIWRAAILAFSGCGFVAFVSGVRIV